MFTEGLDENEINWIKQGSQEEENRVRFPLSPITKKLSLSPKEYSFPKSPIDPIPKSPLLYPSSDFFSPSSHCLPPLKFHPGLLTPRDLVAPPRLDDEEEDDVGNESVASVSYGGNLSEEGGVEVGPIGETDYLEKKHGMEWCEDGEEEEVFRTRPRRMKLNRGLLKEDLRIDVPGGFRRFTNDGELVGKRRSALKTSTPGGGSGAGSSSLTEKVQLRKAHSAINDALKNEGSVIKKLVDLGTPSAPPMMENSGEGESLEVEMEIEQDEEGFCKSSDSESGNGGKDGMINQTSQPVRSTEYVERVNITSSDGKEEKMPYWQTGSSDHSSYFNTSGQYAWQSLIAYDACIRLCLYAWARGCTEAPQFLHDECLVLRSAFGLHQYLLQPRGVQPTEVRNTKSAEQKVHLKAKKVVGKIRVEVRKLRVIPRRKLISTYSLRSAMYLQMGKEYAQYVSSMVKTRMKSLKLASFSANSEEQLSCLFQLKSATEDTQVEPGSNICLFPGSGDYHEFFPESEGDAILIEVQDSKGSVQGRATIPISTFTDDPSDRIRWWPLYHEDQECIGKMQLFIGSTITCEETSNIKSGHVVETLAYDILLEAAMRVQHFQSRNLRVQGAWKWLLTEFADYYGVSHSYTKLRYLSHVMNVATPTKACLELVEELLVPVLKAKGEKSLTRQERSILLDCEAQIERLLANVFENYKSLDENSQTGLADLLSPSQESVAPSLAPAVRVFTLLHDILSQETQNTLRNYLQTAAKKRCRKHMMETDEFVSVNSDGFLMDSITISTAYLKMKNLCINISKEIQADIKIHNQHIFPSSIDLSNIAAAVYSSELSNRLRSFLAAWPPSSPRPHVNELLTAVTNFEQNVELLNIRPVQGGVDSRMLFHGYIMVWVQDMQLNMLELCKAEKIPWAGAITNHSTSPFAEEMYEKIKESIIEYEAVINRWPQYSLILETAVADMERAIIKALEKQYNDILTPLKDSIPKRLNMHVQKLTRRQSTTLYSAPIQLGTFLNTVKRILDVLHPRVENILKSWASYLPVMEDKMSLFGEQMNGITVLLKTKYKNYLQATVEKFLNNMQANRSTRLKRILEEIKEEDSEADVRERMHMLSSQLIDSISDLHEVFTSRIFVAICRGFWDRMGQVVLKFLEGRKENRVWYNGSCYVLGVLDDTFASQMQRLLGNSLQEKDVEPPRSVNEARSILCKDTSNATDASSYFYV